MCLIDQKTDNVHTFLGIVSIVYIVKKSVGTANLRPDPTN